jgi:DNA-binding MurR/RpiR family transcriptional regulator
MHLNNEVALDKSFTVADRKIAKTVLSLQGSIENYSIDDLARASFTSTASISRFCKRLGLNGYRELKARAVQSSASQRRTRQVNIDFPFNKGDAPATIAQELGTLYQLTIMDMITLSAHDNYVGAATVLVAASNIVIFTHSHNMYVAESFAERLTSIGKTVSIPMSGELQRIAAANANETTVAIAISYSGRATFLPKILDILRERHLPVLFIGTTEACRLHPGLSTYLHTNDRENPKERIAQFSSHFALQFVLDLLYACIFSIRYDDNISRIKKNIPLIDDRTFSDTRQDHSLMLLSRIIRDTK